MDGTIDFIILEHDDVAGCALIAGAVHGVVPAIDGYNTPYLRQTAQRCQRISHPIDPPETASATPRSAARRRGRYIEGIRTSN